MKKVLYKLLIWDWRNQIDIDDLKKALKLGYINLYEIDTGGDDNCWIASKVTLKKSEIKKITYKEFYGDDE